MAKFPISFGNRKLPKTTAIFNMTSATDCPSRDLGLCQLDCPSKCYALKAEKQYRKTVLPYRNRQADIWRNCTANQWVMSYTIARGRKKVSAIRFNESGDLTSKKCLAKLVKIAKLLPGLPIYFYSARKDIFTDKALSTLPDNITVNGSGYMAHNEFRVVSADTLKAYAGPKCCGDCTKCKLCETRQNKTIYAEMH